MVAQQLTDVLATRVGPVAMVTRYWEKESIAQDYKNHLGNRVNLYTVGPGTCLA